MAKILIPLTNHATLGDTQEKNGTFVPELTHALHEFLDAGFDYDLVSINGGDAPIYGDEIEDPINQKILTNDDFQSRLRNSLPAIQINPEDYEAIFFPGGFGLLSDLAENQHVAHLTASIYQRGGVVGAVCHGPAGLLPVILEDGTALLANKSVTGFTREEEIDFGTLEKIPYLLEEALTRNAKTYSKAQPWQEHTVVDGRLITGQNPASASAVGKAMVEQLQNR